MSDQASTVNDTDSSLFGADLGSAVNRAFGAQNRARLLDRYFAEAPPVTPENAWEHTYRLLLWIDRTMGLAHCYESDKAQPGRPWYARSLAFHAWLARALQCSPADLANEIDLLFKWATADLVAAAEAARARYAVTSEQQRWPYRGQGLPLPGEDPELQGIIAGVLGRFLNAIPPPEVLRQLAEHIRAHVGQENKRKNLVGEGFEDTVAAVLTRIRQIATAYVVHVRPLLHEVPGFHPPRGTEKARQVDLALIQRKTGYRTLVTCKWSVRSDREEQFVSDFASYAKLEAAGRDFGYVLVTNEFDPARLAAACDGRRENAQLFTRVVHVNPDGPRAAYAAPVSDRGSRGRGIPRALTHADSGRLSSLATWLIDLINTG